MRAWIIALNIIIYLQRANETSYENAIVCPARFANADPTVDGGVERPGRGRPGEGAPPGAAPVHEYLPERDCHLPLAQWPQAARVHQVRGRPQPPVLRPPRRPGLRSPGVS